VSFVLVIAIYHFIKNVCFKGVLFKSGISIWTFRNTNDLFNNFGKHGR